MLTAPLEPESETQHRALRTRQALLRRLADVVCLPSSRINNFERAVVGDLMVEILSEAAVDERRRVAERLAHLSEIPNALLRLLLSDELVVAGPLLLGSESLSDSDLLACVTKASREHRLMMAGRRGLSEVICDALIAQNEADVIQAVLKNVSAKLSQSAIEMAVAQSQQDRALIGPLLRRMEMRPSSAYVMYWWSNPEQRMAILQRFAVSRLVLQDSVEDVFAMAAQGGWSDPLVRTALQFIERRQRNRAETSETRFASLEAAVEAVVTGMNRSLLSEVANLSGIKPLTAIKIFSDPLGDPLAILCKATGLSRRHLHCLWQGMRRPEITATGELDPSWERAQICYEMLAVDRAQTVLRYWNWSLSSALTPRLLRAIREGEKPLIDEYSLSKRA